MLTKQEFQQYIALARKVDDELPRVATKLMGLPGEDGRGYELIEDWSYNPCDDTFFGQGSDYRGKNVYAAFPAKLITHSDEQLDTYVKKRQEEIAAALKRKREEELTKYRELRRELYEVLKKEFEV